MSHQEPKFKIGDLITCPYKHTVLATEYTNVDVELGSIGIIQDLRITTVKHRGMRNVLGTTTNVEYLVWIADLGMGWINQAWLQAYQ